MSLDQRVGSKNEIEGIHAKDKMVLYLTQLFITQELTEHLLLSA